MLRAMLRLALALTLLALAPATALAQDALDLAERGGAPGGGLGLGAESLLLDGGGSVALTYAAPSFRFQGLLGLTVVEDGPTLLTAGGRFLFRVHRAGRADFSVGPGIGLGFRSAPRAPPRDGDDDDLFVTLEGVAQARVFVVESVSLNGSLGLGLRIDDRFALGIGGNLTGGLGFTYYF
jgi:hypothetical protein